MKILCLIPTMGAGGAERVMSYLLGHLTRRHDVTLLTWDAPGSPSFYPVPESVERIRANRLGGGSLARLGKIASRPGVLRGAIKARRPDLVLSFMDTMNITALVAAAGLGVPVIVSERNDPAFTRIGRAKSLARDRSYALADVIAVQTTRIAQYFPDALQPRVHIIPNPVPPAHLVARPGQPGPGGRYRIAAVARLAQQKSLDRLIVAFASVAKGHPDWDLAIFGEGPERPALERLIASYRLEKRVALPGVVDNVAAELAASHLMAISSHYEGFPNALAEGAATGLPTVGFAETSGVEDLIVHRETGLLVAQTSGASGLAEALGTLMSNAKLRARMGEAGRTHVARWSPDGVFALWDAAIAAAIARHQSRTSAPR